MLTVRDGRTMTARTVTSPRVGGTCLVWASKALDGSPRGGTLLETTTGWWTWWWRELLLGSLALALAAVAAVRRMVRKPRD